MKDYKTVLKENRCEIVIEKSRFISSIYHIESFEEANDFLCNIRKEFYDATHNCYAYVIGDNCQTQKFSDDGEPQGTAGMPILEVIKQNGITNVLVVVTRYFGGIKLGAGGLTRAYVNSTVEAIKNSKIVKYEGGYRVKLSCDYSTYQVVNRYILQNNYKMENVEFNSDVSFELLLKKDDKDPVVGKLIDLTNNKIRKTTEEEIMNIF